MERAGVKELNEIAPTHSSIRSTWAVARPIHGLVIGDWRPTRGRPNAATLVDGIIFQRAIGVAGGTLLINPACSTLSASKGSRAPKAPFTGEAHSPAAAVRQ